MIRLDGWRRIGLVSIFLVLGSSNPIAIKWALLLGWQPMTLGLLRMSFIGLFFLGFAGLTGEHPIGPTPEARLWALTAAACKGLAVLCFYYALVIIPVNRAVILSTIAPIVNLALVHFILQSERVRRRHILGIGMSFFGMLSVLLLRHGPGSPGPVDSTPFFLGDLAMITSVVFHQAMIVYEKKALIGGANPRQLIISTNLVSVGVFGLMVLCGSESLREIPTEGGAVAAYLYLITFVGILLFWYRRWLVSILDVSYINSFSHAGKALSLLYAVLLLGERIPRASLIGLGFILLGTVVAAGFQQEQVQTSETG